MLDMLVRVSQLLLQVIDLLLLVIHNHELWIDVFGWNIGYLTCP